MFEFVTMTVSPDDGGVLSGVLWRDILTLVCLVVGAFFVLAAGLGLWRFHDLLGRLHAQSKPQTAGLLFMLIAVGLQTPQWGVIVSLLPVIIFQFLTTPAAAIVLARGGYRTKYAGRDHLYVDELGPEVADAQAEAELQIDDDTRHDTARA